jgi:dUTP pyrophosphatase
MANEITTFLNKFIPDDTLRVKKLRDDIPYPRFGYEGDAGMDICSALDVIIPPNSYKKIKTGLSFGIPPGYELQVRGRSGLASRGIICHFGTVDSGYTGEVSVILYNFNDKSFPIEKGTRIAQIVPKRINNLKVESSDNLEETERGNNGFGSTDL